LKVYDATGENKEKTVDYAGLRKDKPTVYLFIGADTEPRGKFDRPMNKFMKTLDTQVEKELDDVYMVAVWLSDTEDKTKDFLTRIQTSVAYEKTALTVFKGKDGPKGWDINSDAHLTVIIANKGKVTTRFGYKTVNDTDVKAVMKELKKVAKEKKK
jgi:hypothetical protein